MIRKWRVLMMVVFSLLTGMTLGEAASPVALRDFFRNPEISSLEWSPDGTRLAFLAPVDRRLNLFVKKPDEARPKQVTHVTDRDIV
jgi:hypothetical protein